MDTASLVVNGIGAGKKILDALRAAGFPITAAFWIHEKDHERWRLWIATPRFAEDPDAAMQEVASLVTDYRDTELGERVEYRLEEPDHPLVKGLLKKSRTQTRDAVRIGPMTVSRQFIDGAVIYRTGRNAT